MPRPLTSLWQQSSNLEQFHFCILLWHKCRNGRNEEIDPRSSMLPFTKPVSEKHQIWAFKDFRYTLQLYFAYLIVVLMASNVSLVIKLAGHPWFRAVLTRQRPRADKKRRTLKNTTSTKFSLFSYYWAGKQTRTQSNHIIFVPYRPR